MIFLNSIVSVRGATIVITHPRCQKKTQICHCLRFKIHIAVNSKIIFSYNTMPHYHYGTCLTALHTEHDSNRTAILACWLHTSYLQRSVNIDKDRCGVKDTYSYWTDQNSPLRVAYCNYKRYQNTSHSIYIKQCFCTIFRDIIPSFLQIFAAHFDQCHNQTKELQKYNKRKASFDIITAFLCIFS